MSSTRYVIALLLVVILPAGMSMWFVIHPFAEFWRRHAPGLAYAVVIGVASGVALALYQSRQFILTIDFGFSWVLSALGVVILCASIVLERKYREQIRVATLLGLPEVSGARESRLLTEGIYGAIRHPRYVGLMLEISAFALFANYLAGYVVVLAMVPVVYLTVLLEERELRTRFGVEYNNYASRVPRFLPRRWSPINRSKPPSGRP